MKKKNGRATPPDDAFSKDFRDPFFRNDLAPAASFPTPSFPFGNFGTFGGIARRMLAPPVIDVFERPHEVVVTAELPGTRKEDIAIKVLENGLQLHVEKNEHKESKNEGREGGHPFQTFQEESRFEGYSQYVAFPAACKPKQAKATYKNGVLEVRIPKLHGKKGHAIKVD